MVKHARVLIIALAFLSIAMLPRGIGSLASPEGGSNRALADLSLCWANYTMEDSISNLPVAWIKSWYFRIVNLPDDSHLVVTNPNITVETTLGLVEFYPPPTVSHPPFYQWIYSGTVAENYWFSSTGFENESKIDRPRFSASRIVTPERLSDLVTNQTVQVIFRLEEDLPPEVNEVAVTAGFYPVVTGHTLAPKLVDYVLLESSSPDNWEIYHHGESAIQWTVFNTSQIHIGETYEFNAIFRVTKSEHLQGSPLSKPYTTVIWRRIDTDHHSLFKSVRLEHPEGVVAIFQADEQLGWTSVVSSSYRQFNFGARVTSVVGDEPPFHTLSELLFTLHSCADLHVYDAMERHIGLNYETNETEVMIPGASFEVMDGDQVITIPDPLPGNYSVILVGTSTGPYELSIEGAAEGKTFYTENILGLIEPGIERETGVSIPRTVGMITVGELPMIHALAAGLLLLGLATVTPFRRWAR